MNKDKSLDFWLHEIADKRRSSIVEGFRQAKNIACRLGILPPARKTVVIGGTNGKGSTVVFLEKLLLNEGLSVGATLSPHVHAFNERIRINGQDCTDRLIANALCQVASCVSENEQISYFDYTTLAALFMFKEESVQVAILEVGLGGRYDAANVVDCDIASITSIGMDHRSILGEDRNSIGAEKVEICRRHKPLVFGDTSIPRSISNRIKKLDVGVFRSSYDFNERVNADATWNVEVRIKNEKKTFRLPVPPTVDRRNASTAVQIAALAWPNLSENAIRSALSVSLPGRFEIVNFNKRQWILDVAHNTDGIYFLCRRICETFGGRLFHCVFGANCDKDIICMIKQLKVHTESLVVTDVYGDKSMDAVSVIELLGTERSVKIVPELEDAIDLVCRSSTFDDIHCIVGSFDLIARARGFIAGH